LKHVHKSQKNNSLWRVLQLSPTDVEIVGVKEAITLTGFVGKRGITGVATVGVPVDAKRL